MPIFIDLGVAVAIFLLIIFIASQIIVPYREGEPLFPYFRKSAVKDEIYKAERALEGVAEIAHLKKVVNQLNSRLAEMEKNV